LTAHVRYRENLAVQSTARLRDRDGADRPHLGRRSRHDHLPSTPSTPAGRCVDNHRPRAVCRRRDRCPRHAQPRPSGTGRGKRTPPSTRWVQSRHDGRSGPAERPIDRPSGGSSGVSPSTPISVTLSSPLSKSSPLPTVSPTTAGSWRASGSTLTFTPSTDFAPLGTIAVTVPGGGNGVVGTNGGRLGPIGQRTVPDRERVCRPSPAAPLAARLLSARLDPDRRDDRSERRRCPARRHLQPAPWSLFLARHRLAGPARCHVAARG